jgi:hypothetical protein
VWAVDTAEFRMKLAALPLLLTAEFYPAVDEYARHYLEEHGIADEPITWSPNDFHVAAGSALSRVCGTGVDHAHPIELMAGTARRVVAANRRSGKNRPMLSYLAEVTPTGGSAGCQALGGHLGAMFSAARILPKPFLVDLYLTQQLGLAAIADRMNLSRQMVTHLARAYGVSLRPPGRPRNLG